MTTGEGGIVKTIRQYPSNEPFQRVNLSLVEVDEPYTPTLPEYVQERARAFWYRHTAAILIGGSLAFLALFFWGMGHLVTLPMFNSYWLGR